LSEVAAGDKLMDLGLAFFASRGSHSAAKFKGGKIGKRDNWGDFKKRPDFKKFRKWLHRFYKKKGQPDLSREQLEEAWEIWKQLGRPGGH